MITAENILLIGSILIFISIPSYRLYPDFHQHPNQQNRIQVRHPDFIALPISGHVFRKRRAWYPVP